MIIPNLYIGDLQNKWFNYFNHYKEDILKLQKAYFNEEDYNGRSKIQYKIQQYYLAFELGVMIWQEMKWNNQSWEYYKTKYDLDNKATILSCLGIDFNIIKNIFELNTIDSSIQIFDSSDDELQNVIQQVYDISELLKNEGEIICKNDIYYDV